MNGRSHALILALCALVWVLMGILPVCIYRLRGVRKFVALLVVNAAMWGAWIQQYRLIRANPPWATANFRLWLLLVESGVSIVVLFSMMVRERERMRARILRRLEWDG